MNCASYQAYFVQQYQRANLLTPNYILCVISLCEYTHPYTFISANSRQNKKKNRVLFITSILAAAWAIATVLRRKSTRRSALFVSFIDLCFVGALIASVYELRAIAKADCTTFSNNGSFSITLDNNGFSGNNPFSLNVNKTCAMLKASFAFGIMNIIFFLTTAFLLLFMKRGDERDNVVVKETYRRRSHESRYALFPLFPKSVVDPPYLPLLGPALLTRIRLTNF